MANVNETIEHSFPASDPPGYGGTAKVGSPQVPLEPSDGITISGRKLDPSILREYDIRGVVGETVNEADARAIGRAFGRLAGGHGHRIALGRDGRRSSPALHAAVAEGLMEAGARVEDIGIGPTPMLYFAVHHLTAVGGIMVTGSHNPPDHNGFKMVLGYQPVFAEDIRRLGDLAAADFEMTEKGEIETDSVMEAYVDRLMRDFDGARPLDVAWDAGNGAAGEAMAALAKRIPGRHYLLNSEIDGGFPNHHPDPTVPENLVQLQKLVLDKKCDLGIAFDGDGDRIGVVDEQGRIVWADQLLLLLARDVLEAHPGATVIADVKASQIVFDDIAAHGGVPLMWKSGHANLRSKLAEIGGPLAGEMSGHIFYADRFYGHDDALYAAVRLLSCLSKAKTSLAAIIDGLPRVVNTPEIRFPCRDDKKFEIVERLGRAVKSSDARIERIDGVRVTHPDGWWLLRASNTQAVLVARCEGRDGAALDRMKRELRGCLDSVGVAAPNLD